MTSKSIDLKTCSFQEWDRIDEGHLLEAALQMEDDCEAEQFFSLLRALGVWLVMADFYAGGDQITGDGMQFIFKRKEGLFRISLGFYGDVEDRLGDHSVNISHLKEDLYELVTKQSPIDFHASFVDTFWDSMASQKSEPSLPCLTTRELFQVDKIGMNTLHLIRDWIESDSGDRVYSEFWGGNGSFSAYGHTVYLPFNGAISMHGSGPDYELLSDAGEDERATREERIGALRAMAYQMRRRYKYALSMKKRRPKKYCTKAAFSAWRQAFSDLCDAEVELYYGFEDDAYEDVSGSFFAEYEAPGFYEVHESLPKRMMEFAKEQEAALFEEKP